MRHTLKSLSLRTKLAAVSATVLFALALAGQERHPKLHPQLQDQESPQSYVNVFVSLKKQPHAAASRRWMEANAAELEASESGYVAAAKPGNHASSYVTAARARRDQALLDVRKHSARDIKDAI